MGLESFDEEVFDLEREPQENITSGSGSCIAGRLKDVLHLMIVEAWDDGRKHHADRDTCA